jgi:hypothetical protein
MFLNILCHKHSSSTTKNEEKSLEGLTPDVKAAVTNAKALALFSTLFVFLLQIFAFRYKGHTIYVFQIMCAIGMHHLELT